MTGAYFAGVNWLLLAPAKSFSGVPVILAHQDKIAHFGMFLALALLVCWSLQGARGIPRLRGVTLAALVLHAGLVEFSQPLLASAGRTFDWLDLACNYGGVAAGWLAAGCWGFGVRTGSGDQSSIQPGEA